MSGLASKRYTLAQLAQMTNNRLVGDPHHVITGVDDLESALESDISFLSNPRYNSQMQQSKAGAICIHENMTLMEGKNFLVSSDPSRTFQMIVELFFQPKNLCGFEGVHPTAVIHPQARIAKGVTIGPYAIIDSGAHIQEDTKIGPFVYVGCDVKIGKNCLLHAHSVIREHCILEDRVILQPGAIIGSCGFGYTTNAKGEHIKLEQLGNVVLEEDVEIGANTTVDRARFKTTRISKGSKIDNLVQIGHNVQIGPHNIIVSQTGVAGSSKTGRNVVMGGQAGIVGHVEIADFVMIATRGGVSKSITKTGKYGGGPVMELADYNRQQVHLRKIEEYVERIEALEEKLQELQQRLSEPSVSTR